MPGKHNEALRVPGVTPSVTSEARPLDADRLRKAQEELQAEKLCEIQADAERREKILAASHGIPDSMSIAAIVQGVPADEAIAAFEQYRREGFGALRGSFWGEKK